MRAVLFRAISLALTSAAFLPPLARADDAASEASAADAKTLDSVVVSAQKRITNLQKTSISATVLNDEALADRHVVSLGSLSDGSIPSLRVAPFATRSSALGIGIRGIGASGDANQPARDAGVGVYVDGVFLGRAQGLGAALYDVERIEVLKGPQGTLFGRNTEGGAISIVTKQPSGEFHFDGTAGVSNYGGYQSAAHLDMPKIGDFSFKLDGVIDARGGTADNPMRGEKDFNSYDKRGLRLSALWQPSDVFTGTYAYDNSHDETTPYYDQLLVAGPYASVLQKAGVSTRRRAASILGGPQEASVGKTSGHMLVLDWTLGEELELKSISSYRELEQGQFDQGLIDALATFTKPYGTFGRYSLAQVWQHQYSEELQLIGSAGQWQYVAGAFYYREAVRDNAQTPLTNLWNADGTGYTLNPATMPLDLKVVPIDRASQAWTRSLGIFGQSTWTPEAVPQLHVTAGARYTRDDKNGDLYILNGAASSLRFSGSWGRVDPMLNIAWDLGEQAMVYAKWSTGFKAGGANSRSLSYRTFDPEQVSVYELGFKSQFLDDRARLNLAVFDAQIQHKQMDFVLPLALGSKRTIIDTTNAGADGTSRGAEVELSVKPLDSLTLSVNYAYTDIGALSAPNPYVAGNPSTTVLPLFAPKNAGSAALDYYLPLGRSALKFHVDGNWADGYYTSETEPTLTDASFVVNARLALVDVPLNASGATAEFSLWSRNLLDEKHIFYKNISPSLGTYGIFNDPRTFGVQAHVRF